MSEPASTDRGTAVRADGLERWFGEVPALREVSFELAPGATLAVLGPNGSGKSTLLRILATLLRPSRGAAAVLGAELPREAWRARGSLGYLGHAPLLYAELSGRENLRYHAALFGLESPAARIEELLGVVGMAGRADRRIAEMSAGMAQRIAICRAVLHDPQLLLLDEPDAHLDEAARADVAPLLGRAPGRTRIVVTHDLEVGLAAADQALVLDRRGRPAYSGRASGTTAAEARRAYGETEPGG